MPTRTRTYKDIHTKKGRTWAEVYYRYTGSKCVHQAAHQDPECTSDEFKASEAMRTSVMKAWKKKILLVRSKYFFS